MRIKMYQSKEQQIRFFKEQEEECHLWLTQNLHQQKMLSIMSLVEQMVETRSWKAAQGIIEDGRCLVCHRHDETMKHLAAGWTILSNSEYLARHNRALMIFAVTWANKNELIEVDTVWYKEQWGARKNFWGTIRWNLSGISNSTYKKRDSKKTHLDTRKKHEVDLDLQHCMSHATKYWYELER